ncbi:1-phosphofructokinase family hexose kinase [Flavobacterium sp.]|uniref:1-phosphofructokinase family hexose kinase n=1 Tax=Flavobacterium sp. TaxID=239 RepID=UPI00286BF077|nr:1-phosphofructokinase family hexose kinase [Flavobacterium sp.]
MKSYDIITLTVNPALDKSAQFSGLIAEQKIRCEEPQFDAGGGGINVSKAIHRLGGESLSIFTSGGPIGSMLEACLQKEAIPTLVIPTKNWTRENFVAFDIHTKLQYRFGFPGATLSEAEQQQIIQILKSTSSKYLVLSGSLNKKLSADFYQQIVKAIVPETKIIVDTSGDALKKVLESGVYLVKPNVGELAKLIGVEKLEMDEVADAAKKLILKGSAQIVVVSLGPHGAILVTKDQTIVVPAPNVVRKSTVGAGDSMVGAMVWALSKNKPLKEVVQWGVACGSAATMNEGTQLFKVAEAKRLFEWLQKE